MASAKIALKPYQLPRSVNYQMTQHAESADNMASFCPIGPGLTIDTAHHVLDTESEYRWPEVLDMLQSAYEAGKAEGRA